MSQVKHSSTFWEGSGPDGNRVVLHARMILIGSSATSLDSYLTQVFDNLRGVGLNMVREEDLASLLKDLPAVQLG